MSIGIVFAVAMVIFGNLTVGHRVPGNLLPDKRNKLEAETNDDCDRSPSWPWPNPTPGSDIPAKTIAHLREGLPGLRRVFRRSSEKRLKAHQIVARMRFRRGKPGCRKAGPQSHFVSKRLKTVSNQSQ
jgi:hypothetical protein